MRSDSAYLAHEKAAHRDKIFSTIGRQLREQYAAAPRPLPDRLADLVRKIEQSTGKNPSKRV